MRKEQKIMTIKNVVSDLNQIIEDIESGGYSDINDAWEDAQLACEYITENTPH